MRQIGKFYGCIFILITLASCDQNKNPVAAVVEVKKMDYPSGSSIEFYQDRIYLIGDDSPDMIILDTSLTILDSVNIILYPGKRIPREIKPDLEASAIHTVNNEAIIFLLGSGSLDPYRNSGWKFNLHTRTKENIYLLPFYSRLKKAGIEQINIEGAAFVNDKLILVNRGNKGYPYNHLIITGFNFLETEPVPYTRIIPFEEQKDTALFKGISGLLWSAQRDELIMTVSTEDTRNTYDDGVIGKSYLWIINNITGKLNSTTLKPDKIIDLENTDGRFKGHKIESAAIIDETKHRTRLVLVADNDEGSSTIFKMDIKRP